MKFSFRDHLPDCAHLSPVIISGHESYELPYKEFILQHEGEQINGIYEIRYLTSGGPYKDVIEFGNFLVVGHYQFVYFYDLVNCFNTIRLEVDGYFGHIYINDEVLYIADSGCLRCYNKNGKLVWCNTNLGIDGVFISDFTNEFIHGSGQWDPPDGWRDFKLDIKTGNLTNSG